MNKPDRMATLAALEVKSIATGRQSESISEESKQRDGRRIPNSIPIPISIPIFLLRLRFVSNVVLWLALVAVCTWRLAAGVLIQLAFPSRLSVELPGLERTVEDSHSVR